MSGPITRSAASGSQPLTRHRSLPFLLLAFAGAHAYAIGSPIDAPTVAPTEPSPEATFQAPAFPHPPRLVELPGKHRSSRPVARAELSYWKLDGRELGPWGADLYLPQGDGAFGNPVDRTRAPDRDRGPGGSAHSAREEPGGRSSSERPTRPDATGQGGAAAQSPLIVVLPIGGLRKDLRSYYAKAFAKHGFAVLALGPLPAESGSGILHSLKGTARTLTEDASNLRRILAWASALPPIDTDRVGVLGVSRGAIGTALVAQLDPRLSTVLVLGGADLAGLFRDSRLGIVERMRSQETARAGGSLEKAVEKARRILQDVDPATLEGGIDPARTILINARWDRIIPREQALALRRAAGNPRQFWLPSGHYGSLLFSRRVRHLALEHFMRTLGPAPHSSSSHQGGPPSYLWPGSEDSGPHPERTDSGGFAAHGVEAAAASRRVPRSSQTGSGPLVDLHRVSH